MASQLKEKRNYMNIKAWWELVAEVIVVGGKRGTILLFNSNVLKWLIIPLQIYWPLSMKQVSRWRLDRSRLIIVISRSVSWNRPIFLSRFLQHRSDKSATWGIIFGISETTSDSLNWLIPVPINQAHDDAYGRRISQHPVITSNYSINKFIRRSSTHPRCFNLLRRNQHAPSTEREMNELRALQGAKWMSNRFTEYVHGGAEDGDQVV